MASTTKVTTKSFLSTIREAVIADMISSGVLASLSAAQATLESGNGTSALARSANNLFGIKGEYNGAYVTMKTKEWDANKGYYEVYAKFRKYPSVRESIADHSAFLKKYSRYAEAVACKPGEWEKCATLMGKSGYATDPNYASKLISIIRTNRLYEYDEAGSANTIDRPGGNPYPLPTRNVSFGTRDIGCRWVQYQLNLAGYSLVVDGICGVLTDAAIRHFQQSNGLKVDGIAGPLTITKLMEY